MHEIDARYLEEMREIAVKVQVAFWMFTGRCKRNPKSKALINISSEMQWSGPDRFQNYTDSDLYFSNDNSCLPIGSLRAPDWKWKCSWKWNINSISRPRLINIAMIPGSPHLSPPEHSTHHQQVPANWGGKKTLKFRIFRLGCCFHSIHSSNIHLISLYLPKAELY